MKKREKRANRGSFFYVLVLLCLAAVAAMVVMLAPGAKPDTPPVLLSPPPARDSVPASPTPEQPGDRVIAVTPATVQSMLAMFDRADSYSRTLTVQNFWADGSAETNIQVWVRGENTRVTIQSESGGPQKNILIKNDTEWIWYSDGVSLWEGTALSGDADAWQSLPTYEDVLALDPSEILDAGYTDDPGEACVYVRCVQGLLGYEHVYYISNATGLLVRAEVYDGQQPVYIMRASPADISTPADELFAVPTF